MKTGQVVSLRIPIVSTAGGFGVLFPQLFLSFGGNESDTLLEDGEVLFSERLRGI